MKPKTKMIDVAKEAGVSVSTVSRVLNEEDNVSEETRKAVLDAISLLNYSRLRRSTVDTDLRLPFIGVVIPDFTILYFGQVLQGAAEIAYSHGYSLLITDSMRDLQRERLNIQQLISRGAAGLLVAPISSSNESILDVLDGTCPYVFIDRYLWNTEKPRVCGDGRQGSYQAAKYLLSLGHQRIVYIEGSQRNSNSRDRLKGFLEAFEDAEISIDSDLIIPGEYDSEISYTTLRELISVRSDFTAVFAESEFMAIGAQRALIEAGMRIPQDVSLMTIGESSLSEMMGWSVLQLPAREIGNDGVRMLLDMIMLRKDTPASETKTLGFILRESCAMINTAAEEGDQNQRSIIK